MTNWGRPNDPHDRAKPRFTRDHELEEPAPDTRRELVRKIAIVVMVAMVAGMLAMAVRSCRGRETALADGDSCAKLPA